MPSRASTDNLATTGRADSAFSSGAIIGLELIRSRRKALKTNSIGQYTCEWENYDAVCDAPATCARELAKGIDPIYFCDNHMLRWLRTEQGYVSPAAAAAAWARFGAIVDNAQ